MGNTTNVSLDLENDAFFEIYLGQSQTARDELIAAYSKAAKPKNKSKGGKKDKGQKSKTPPAWVVTIVTKNTGVHSTASFLEAMRIAGKRSMEKMDALTGEILTIPGWDPIAEKADQKDAITGFQGWTDEAHGIQLDRAMLHARFLANGKHPVSMMHKSPERHSARRSGEGWVAGLPNRQECILADLQARERVAIGEMITVERLLGAASLVSRPMAEGEDPIAYLTRHQEAVLDFDRALALSAKEAPIVVECIRRAPDKETFLLKVREKAMAAFHEVSRDIDLFDGTLCQYSTAPWKECERIASREFHAPIREGETETELSMRRSASQDLYNLVQIAQTGNKEASQECFAFLVERQHKSMSSRHDPIFLQIAEEEEKRRLAEIRKSQNMGAV